MKDGASDDAHEVLREVHDRIVERGSVGESDISALAFWQRLQANWPTPEHAGVRRSGRDGLRRGRGAGPAASDAGLASRRRDMPRPLRRHRADQVRCTS